MQLRRLSTGELSGALGRLNGLGCDDVGLCLVTTRDRFDSDILRRGLGAVVRRGVGLGRVGAGSVCVGVII